MISSLLHEATSIRGIYIAFPFQFDNSAVIKPSGILQPIITSQPPSLNFPFPLLQKHHALDTHTRWELYFLTYISGIYIPSNHSSNKKAPRAILDADKSHTLRIQDNFHVTILYLSKFGYIIVKFCQISAVSSDIRCIVLINFLQPTHFSFQTKDM